MKKYVIIGNSAAAVGAVTSIRETDQEGSIVIISKEPYHTYSRPLISYWLQGKVTEEKMLYRDKDFYKANNCTLLPGKEAVSIDQANKIVVLASGENIAYDKLLVCTGSTPLVPPMEGLEKVEKKFTFLSFDDAKAIKAAVSADSRVLILGAGLIGLKAAEALNNQVAQITVVDLADRILPSILDAEGAEMMQRHIENQGVVFRLGDSVKQFSCSSALLHSGLKIDFDLLILAVGVRPNCSLLTEARAKTGKGIQTDHFQRTSLPDIYAAGDCTESLDISSGQKRNLALLPNAYLQGEAAGYNMAGKKHTYDKAIPMNAIGFFGLHIITAGCYEGEVYAEHGEGTYKKLFFKNDLLKGFILIGDIKRAGIYTNLIRQQVPLSSVDQETLFKHPALMAMGKEYRLEKLAGKIR